MYISIRVTGERFPKHPPKSQMERVFWGPTITEEHVLINRYRIPGGSETEGFITSRIPFVNMIGTGLDTGHMKPQLPSGTFDLYFSNGFISTCYTEEELQDLIQRKGFQQTK